MIREGLSSEIADVKIPKKPGMKKILRNILQPNSKRDEAYKSILPYLLRIEKLETVNLEKYYITIPEQLLSPNFWKSICETKHALSFQKPQMDTSKIEAYFDEQEKKGEKNKKQKENNRLRIYIEEVKNLEKYISNAFEKPDMQMYLNMKNMNKESLPQDPKFFNIINQDIIGNIKHIKVTTQRILEIFETTRGDSFKKYIENN